MHREHAAFGHPVVHRREDALLHFTRVVRAQNDHFFALEVEHHARVRADSLDAAVSALIAGVIDHEVGLAKILEFLFRGPDKQVVHEQRVISPRASKPHFDAVRGVPSREAVDHVNHRTRPEVIDGVAPDGEKAFVAGRNIDASPPELIRAFGVFDNSLVERAAAGLFARKSRQRSGRDDRSLFTQDRVLIEQRR